MDIERIPLDGDTPGQEFGIRVIRFHGSGNGPRVYLQAALHAHEMPGMAALDRLIPRLLDAEGEGRLKGSITLVPHANPIGLAQAVFGETLGRFDLNGRTNFNRSFPTEPPDMLSGKSAAERLKSVLLSLAVQADVVLDLHCDDEGPIYLYVAERQLSEGRRLARAIGGTVILTDKDTSFGTFDHAVADRWASESRADDARFAATVELRGMIDVTPQLAEHDADGLYRYLVDVGAVIDELPPVVLAEPVVGDVDAAELIATPEPGVLFYLVEIGDWVAEGHRLVLVLTEAGTSPHEIIAPFDGLVMTRLDKRFARRGEHVIKVLRYRHPHLDA